MNRNWSKQKTFAFFDRFSVFIRSFDIIYVNVFTVDLLTVVGKATSQLTFTTK